MDPPCIIFSPNEGRANKSFKWNFTTNTPIKRVGITVDKILYIFLYSTYSLDSL